MDGLINEVEDFDLVPGEYRAMAYGFDLDGNDLSESLVLGVTADPEEAIKVAKLKAEGFKQLFEKGNTKWGDVELSLVVVSVETVVQVDGEEQYVGTLFTEGIPV